MPLLVVIVTAHAGVIGTLAERRTSLVPEDMRAHNFAKLGGEEVVLSYYRVEAQSTIDPHESPHFLKDSCWPYFAAKS
jgi:hypothetical protein